VNTRGEMGSGRLALFFLGVVVARQGVHRTLNVEVVQRAPSSKPAPIAISA
jgi:hypothetical protein